MKSSAREESTVSDIPCTSSISLLAVIRHLNSLRAQMKQQERDGNEQIPALIAAIIPPDTFSFSAADIRRIIKYYQLALNLICDNLSQLNGKKLTTDEHRCILLCSIFLPLFDDLFDEQILEHDQIAALVASPENYSPSNTIDLIVHQLYLQILTIIPQKQLFIRHLKEVCYWEQESLKQFNRDMIEQELMEITYKKSYFSILLFCSVMEDYPDTALVQLLYPFAGLMQLTNDVFDVWKDLQKKLYTIPNLYPDYSKLESLFRKEIKSVNDQTEQLSYPEKNRKQFLIRTHTLNAMGWLSIQQLKSATAGKPLTDLGRKELVCDLDNIPQKIKWLRTVRRLCNL